MIVRQENGNELITSAARAAQVHVYNLQVKFDIPSLP
jgi:hypothetical protein